MKSAKIVQPFNPLLKNFTVYNGYYIILLVDFVSADRPVISTKSRHLGFNLHILSTKPDLTIVASNV